METETEPTIKECKWCERFWAGSMLLVAGILAYISLDVIANGKLTAVWSKPKPQLDFDDFEDVPVFDGTDDD